jgi:hypothetical protein
MLYTIVNDDVVINVNFYLSLKKSFFSSSTITLHIYNNSKKCNHLHISQQDFVPYLQYIIIGIEAYWIASMVMLSSE